MVVRKSFKCKCGSYHSLINKSTKVHRCGTVVVGLEWDNSDELEDRIFCQNDYHEPAEMEQYADSLYMYLKSGNKGTDFLVTIGDPTMGKWKAGCLVVILFDSKQDMQMPLMWCGCPVLVEMVPDCDDESDIGEFL